MEVGNFSLKNTPEFDLLINHVEEPNFRRTRKAFEFFSVIIIFYNLLGANINNISPFGISTDTLARSELLLPSLFIVYIYLFFRYKLASKEVKRAIKTLKYAIFKDYAISLCEKQHNESFDRNDTFFTGNKISNYLVKYKGKEHPVNTEVAIKAKLIASWLIYKSFLGLIYEYIMPYILLFIALLSIVYNYRF